MNTFTLQSLRPLDRTTAQLKYACAYEVGDVVVPARDYRRYGMNRRQQYRVIARDLEHNQLTLQGPTGDPFPFNPATCADKTTYTVQQLAISPGDQLRWTRNEAIPGIRNGQAITVEAVDAKGTATLLDSKGNTTTLDLTGQQYLDYAWVSTTYSSQGKTADRVLTDIDSTLSKEGLYVAVSRAKTNLKLYTADKEQLYKKAQRTAAKNNPSDYLPLFKLVNPNAENKKAADPARDVRSADQSQYLGDRAGERIEVSHRTAVRRDRPAQSRSEPATDRASRIPPEYVADVRAVVTGIEERRRTQELEGQAERIGEAAEAIVSGAGQLEQTATAIARLNGELEQFHQTYRSGRERIAERRRRRQQYEAIASQVSVSDPVMRDLLVAERLISKALAKRGGDRLSEQDVKQIGQVLTASPEAQQRKRSESKAEATDYLVKVMNQAAENMARSQRRSRQRDQGMEL